MILIDADIAIDILRNHPPAIEWLERESTVEVTVLGYTAMELLQGARDRAAERRVEGLLADLDLVWPGSEAGMLAMEIFRLYRLSHSIGLVDAFVAGGAIAMKVPLQSFNQKHFAPVQGLELRQPYAR